ncbi:MAG: 2,3-bisphosphoglycerate-independent phosphoglycerate mutase, partial [Planctomycetota bacterium]
MTNSDKKPVVLVILDGWGVDEFGKSSADATISGKTPNYHRLKKDYPFCLLSASGPDVGLPDGQMGNSEVGHMNLGAGRIVYQDLTRIDKAIEDGSFSQNPAMRAAFERVASRGATLHLMGLCSDGGVHSHIAHLDALIEFARSAGVENILIHCFTDGRDTSPTSGIDHVRHVHERTAELGAGRIATVIGRYFAMDRDKRWERTKEAYDAIVAGKGHLAEDPVKAVADWYEKEKTDEFIPATVIPDPSTGSVHSLKEGDGIVFYNFRGDRARQITTALTDAAFDGFDRERIDTDYVCLTEYGEEYELPIAFPPVRMDNTLAEVLAANGKRQFRLAETEKYAHVTFFFNGGVEEPSNGEDRVLVPSPKVATYDLQPEMSVDGVTGTLVERLEGGTDDFILVNFANPDMVGHTGDFDAAVRAVEAVDHNLGLVLSAVESAGGTAFVTADHGNAE